MNTEWTNILLQGFAGGITGYVTNNYALNMLFREYTPLKLGGVIKKTKTEFIEAISQLVERDLLSPSHLKDEFLKEEALEEWNILFASLWDEFFQADFQGMALKEVPGIQKNLPDWIDTLVASGLRPIEQGDLDLPDLTLESLLNQESFSFLLKRILMQSIAEIQQGTMIDLFLSQLLQAVEGKCLGDFLSDRDLASISHQLSSLAGKGIEPLMDRPEQIDQAILACLSHDQIKDLLDRWEKSWGAKPLADLASKAQIQEIKGVLSKGMKDLDQEEKKTALARDLAKAVTDSPFFNKPILAWFDEASRQALEDLIKDTYQDGFSRLLPLLADREDDIKMRIKRAAETELALQGGMLGGMLQGPLNKTVDGLDLTALAAAYKDRGHQALIQTLENKSLRELGLTFTEDQSLEIITRLLTYGQVHLDAGLEALLTRSAADLIGCGWRETFNQDIKASLAKTLSKKIHGWLASKTGQGEGIDAFLADLVSTPWSENKSQALLEDLKKLNLQPLQTAIMAQIDPLYERVKDTVVPGKWIATALSSRDLQEGIKGQIGAMASNRLDRPIHDFLSPLNQTASRNAFGENLIELIEQHGEEFLDGQVAGLVKTNLQGRDEEEIVELAHDFIGRELQPITKFGFLLGLVAGILLALFPLPQTLMAGPIDLLPVGVFALVGVLTNWIALQMIFRPYKEIKWMKKIPFFRHFAHGYLLKNQRAFATNLAKFVDESLLNRNMIQQLFSDQKKNLKQRWLKWIPDKLPGWTKIALGRKQKEVTQGISRQSQKAILDHAEAWGHDMAASMSAASLPADNQDLKNWLESKGGTALARGMAHWIDRNQSHPLSTWIPAESLPTLIGPLLGRLPLRLPKRSLEDTLSFLAAPALTSRVLPGKDQDLDHILAGMPAAWLRDNLDPATAALLKLGQEAIQKQEALVANGVNEQIQNGLNFLQRGGFVLMGGPALFEQIVHRILTEELPDLIDQESQAISQALKPAVDGALSTKQAVSWSLEKESAEGLKDLISQGTASLMTHGAFKLESFPINEGAANQAIQALRKRESWLEDCLAREMALLAAPLMDRIGLGQVAGLAPASAVTAIREAVRETDQYQAIKAAGWQNILDTLARNTVIGDWIPLSLLADQMRDLLVVIGTQETFGDLIAAMADSALPPVTEEVVSNAVFMDWLAENSFDPLYGAAHSHLPALLSTLSFQDHIVNEVDALPPRDIHKIFLSFAGSYFFRLEIYGLFGAVFGLHPVLPGLALLSEGWKTVKRKKSKGEKI